MKKKMFGYILMFLILLTCGTANAIPISTELITNGTFENFGLGDSNGGYADTGVPGWSTSGAYPVKILGAPDAFTGPRPGATDPYFARGGSRRSAQVAGGQGSLRSIPFVIPVGTTNTEISFWWEFFTFDRKSNDKLRGVAIVEADSNTVVDNICGNVGGRNRGGLEQLGWTNCSKEYDASTLIPGEEYFLRFTPVTTRNARYASWGYIDDVSVLAYSPAVSAVPEPETVWLIGMGIVILGIPMVRKSLWKRT